jgi:hypothetical protein
VNEILQREIKMSKTHIHVGNFIPEIMPVYYMAKIMGLAPFSLYINPVTKEEIIDIKFTSNVCAFTASGATFTILLAGFAYCAFRTEFSFLNDPGDTLCSAVSFPVNFISAVILVITAVTVNRRKVAELLEKLSLIDENLCRLQERCESHKNRKYTQIYWPLMALTVSFMCYDSYVWSKHLDFIFCMMKRYVHVITLTATMQYCKMVQIITNRLSEIHNVLSSTLCNRLSETDMSCILSQEGRSGNKKVLNMSSRIIQVASVDMLNSAVTINRMTTRLEASSCTEAHTILSLRRIYNHIYECTRILNFIFRLPILLDIFRLVTSLISGSYSVVRLFNEPVEAVTSLSFSDFIISRITWILIFFGTLVALTVTCGRATSITKDVAHGVQTFLVQSPLQREQVQQLMLFSQQIFNDGIVFTAAGLFVIDLKLLCTVLTSAITYVIILIQFKSN